MTGRTGPYRAEATDHLTGSRALELQIAAVLALHVAVRLPIGAAVCVVCRTVPPCATRRTLDPEGIHA